MRARTVPPPTALPQVPSDSFFPSPSVQGFSAPVPMLAQELIAILRKEKGEMMDLKIRPDESE